jgi:hypothetical protein
MKSNKKTHIEEILSKNNLEKRLNKKKLSRFCLKELYREKEMDYWKINV